MYIIKYYHGDDYYLILLFATNNKSKAIKYTKKFNNLLTKWKDYYKQYEDRKLGYSWIKEKHVKKHFNRWNSLQNIGECHYEEIEIR